LAFKPNTDDMREAPSLAFMEDAWKAGAIIHAHDPQAAGVAARLFPDEVASGRLVFCDSPEEAAEGADALVIATEWRAFRSLDLEELGERMRQPIIIDGRNIYDPVRMRKLGFLYHGIGTGESLSKRSTPAD
ncbi:MAG: UDP-glucose 6-dehydrogenase, partial [Thermomicrobiales bacterium]|nr:UDP-glucose 6-dehydrogenase [Thermomicrobiales bacterium]